MIVIRSANIRFTIILETDTIAVRTKKFLGITKFTVL